ncbi:MAG: very short patch repair endonuclease [Flavobacteriales bacterium]
MADNLTPEVRSYIMSQIRSKDTKPELLVRKFLHHSGYRFRLHRRDLPGRPDIVLPKYQVAIQVNGCFWHAHPDPKCNVFKMPTTRRAWWKAKLGATRRRDDISLAKLKLLGWKVVVVWECELQPKRICKTLRRIERPLMMREQATDRSTR